MRSIAIVIVAVILLALPEAGRAEMLTGVVRSVDPQGGNLTLKRNDTQQEVRVTVKDLGGLSSVREGDSIALDATKLPQGLWEVNAVKRIR